jgi:decaprenyl-phosphate phosphoribosyltransferase
VNYEKIKYILIAGRPNQWIKNGLVFTGILFAGQLFNTSLFIQTFIGFLIFCMLSATSYILNDIIDYPLDRKHPAKKKRPIASGKLSIPDATFAVFVLSFSSLIFALFVSIPFFIVSFVFLLLHFFYSLYFKQKPVLDIFAISFSFILRAFAGSVVSGYHIQVWLLLTIFFISLFIASVKRHAELVNQGTRTRTSLVNYKETLLLFLTSTFATMTITSYSLYTFLETPPLKEQPIFDSLSFFLPDFEARKWLMVTIPLVVYGIARYGQLLYEREQGEAPEKIIMRDKGLLTIMFLWAAIVVVLLYVF